MTEPGLSACLRTSKAPGGRWTDDGGLTVLKVTHVGLAGLAVQEPRLQDDVGDGTRFRGRLDGRKGCPAGHFAPAGHARDPDDGLHLAVAQAFSSRLDALDAVRQTRITDDPPLPAGPARSVGVVFAGTHVLYPQLHGAQGECGGEEGDGLARGRLEGWPRRRRVSLWIP